MVITINIYYTGKDGNAKAFAEEMAKSGVAHKIRTELQGRQAARRQGLKEQRRASGACSVG
jgi:hypothetical protein